MKKFKRILSLLLVICTIIPLIITTEITSSATSYSSGSNIPDPEGASSNWNIYSSSSTLNSGRAKTVTKLASNVEVNSDGSIIVTNSGNEYRGAGLSSTEATESGVNGMGLYFTFTPNSSFKNNSVYSFAYSTNALTFSPIYQKNERYGRMSSTVDRDVAGYPCTVTKNITVGSSIDTSSEQCYRVFGDAVSVALNTDSSNNSKLSSIVITCITTENQKIRVYEFKKSVELSFDINSSHTVGFDSNGKLKIDSNTYDEDWDEAVYFEEHDVAGTQNYNIVTSSATDQRSYNAVPKTPEKETTYDFISCTATGPSDGYYYANTYGWSHYTGTVGDAASIDGGTYYNVGSKVSRSVNPTSIMSSILSNSGYISFGSCMATNTASDNASYTLESITTTKSGTATTTPAAYYKKTAPTKYKITVESTAGGTASANPTSAKKGDTVTLNATPSSPSSQFSRWVTGDVTLTDPTDPDITFTMPDHDVSIMANFGGKTYAVHFNENKPSGVTDTVSSMPSTQNKAEGLTLTIPGNVPTLKNYSFLSWNTEADGSGTEYKPTWPYESDADVTLYAQWEEDSTYNISYNKNTSDSVSNMPTETHTMNPYEPITLSNKVPTRSEYTFAGWNTNPDGSGTYFPVSGLYKKNDDATLYAQWVSGTNFSFTLNYADGKYGSKGTEENSDVFKTETISTGTTKDITPKSQTGKHDENGGTAAIGNRDTDRTWISENFEGLSTPTYNVEYRTTTPDQQPTALVGPNPHANMWFRGWNTSDDGSGTWISEINNNTIAYLYNKYGSNVTLYAVWGYPLIWNTSGQDINTDFTTSYLSSTQYLAWAYSASLNLQGQNVLINNFNYGQLSPDGYPVASDNGEDAIMSNVKITNNGYYKLFCDVSDKPNDGFYLLHHANYDPPYKRFTPETSSQYMTYLGMLWMPQIKLQDGSFAYNGGNTEFPMNEDGITEMYAVWLPSVTYYSNDGTNRTSVTYSMLDSEKPQGQIVDEVYKPYCKVNVSSENVFDVLNDKAFLGWYTQPIGGTKVSGDSGKSINESIVLYAHWGFKEEFDLNGSNDSNTAFNLQSISENTTFITLPTDTPIHQSGAAFLGWLCSDGETYKEGDRVYVNNANLKFIAQWSASYDVQFNDGGVDATNMPTNGSLSNTSVYQIPSTIPKVKGKIFKCWNDGTTDYYPGDIYYKQSNVTLTAQWDEAWTICFYSFKDYKANIVTYLGVTSSSTATTSQEITYVTVKKNGSAEVSYDMSNYIPSCNKSDFVFTGWATSENGSADSTYNPGKTIKINSDLNLYAKFSKSDENVLLTVNAYLDSGSTKSNSLITTNFANGGTYFPGYQTANRKGNSAKASAFNFTPVKGYRFSSIKQNSNSVFTTQGVNTRYGTTNTFTNDYYSVDNNSGCVTFTAKFGYYSAPTFIVVVLKNSYNLNFYKLTDGEYGTPISAQYTFGGTTSPTLDDYTEYKNLKLLGWAVTTGNTAYDGGNVIANIDVPYKTGMTISDFEANDYIQCKNGVTYNLYPIYQTYTMSYNINNGATGTAPDSEDYVDFVKMPNKTATMDKQGYDFIGWSDNADDNQSKYDVGESYEFIGNTTLYAIWGPKYTVSYNVNGGGGEDIDPQTKIYNQVFTLSDGSSYSRTGYTLYSWTTASDGSGDEYELGGTISENLTGNITLFAKWTPNTYTVTLDKNGGTEDGSATATYDNNTFNITKHAVNGTTELSGYYTATTGGELVVNANGTLVAGVNGYTDSFGKWINTSTNCTLFAYWKKSTYSVTADVYNSVGGTVQPNSANVEAGVVTSVTATANDNEGYEFDYWNTNSSVELNDINNSVASFKMPENNVHLTAHFKLKTYSITYNVGGGGATGSTVNETKTHGVAHSLLGSGSFSRTGYTQDGWSTESLGEKVYELNASYTDNAALTLYPHWTTTKYNVTWVTDGDALTGNYTNGSTDYDTPIVAPNTPTKTGHTFAGWSPAVDATVPAHDVTYTATWNINKYTVSLTPGDGGQTSITSPLTAQPFDYNTEVTIKATPNSGYSFDGWYDTNDTKVYFNPEETFNITSNVVLTAKFVANVQYFNLTIIANNPDVATYTLTDKETTPGGGTYKYAANTNVTLTFTDTENYDFKYWVNGTGKIMSQNAEYTFVMVGNTELTAVYSKKSEKPTDVQHAMVVYETSYGQVIKSMYCDEYGFFDTTQELRLNVPNTPTRVGYECIGWDQTVTEITTVIKAGVKKMIIIKPLYNYNPETFSVTVNFIDKDTGKALDNVDPITKTTTLGSTFKFTATQKLNDKDFICWKNSEGNIVSYSYNFIVYPKDAEDFVLYACYSSTEEYVPQPKIAMTNTIFEEGSIKGSVKMTFEATRTLPDGYTIVEQGFMVYKGEHTFSDGIIPYDLQTTDDNAMKRVGNINEEGVTLYVLNVGKANVDANKEYNVQGYMWVREPDPEDPNKTVLNRYTTELKKVKSGEVLD